ncbi:MAG: hypothetical protein WCL39_01960 [Armatimonadota bacterium]
MLFPKNKIRMLDTYEGRQSEQGWLELDVKSVDIEGASKLLINLDDLEALKQSKTKESDALNAAKKLLGG